MSFPTNSAFNPDPVTPSEQNAPLVKSLHRTKADYHNERASTVKTAAVEVSHLEEWYERLNHVAEFQTEPWAEDELFNLRDSVYRYLR